MNKTVQKELHGTVYTFHLEVDDENLHIKDVKVGGASIIAIFDLDQLQLAYNDFFQQFINRAA